MPVDFSQKTKELAGVDSCFFALGVNLEITRTFFKLGLPVPAPGWCRGSFSGFNLNS